MMRQGMRGLRKLFCLRIAAVCAGALLCTGLRAAGIRHGFPFTERMIRLEVIRVDGTANAAFFPVLCIVMLADKGVVRLFTIFSLADIAAGLCLAGSGSAAVRGLVQHCFAGRADVPVVGAVAGPYIRTSMTSCRNYRILLRNLRFARCIREQLFADGAGPICYIAIFRAGGSFCFGLVQGVVSHGDRHIGDLCRAGFIRELFVAGAALPVFDTAGSSAGGSYSFVMRQGMRNRRNLSCFGIAAVRAGTLLCTGLRAGRILFGDPTTKGVICSGGFINRVAVLASLPMLRIAVIPLIVMCSGRTVFLTADFTSSLLGAGSMSATMGFLIKRLAAGRTNMPVIRIVVVPAGFIGCVAGSRNHDAVVVGDLMLAAFIREPCTAGGADPVFLIASCRAGCVLCRNSSQCVGNRQFYRNNCWVY